MDLLELCSNFLLLKSRTKLKLTSKLESSKFVCSIKSTKYLKKEF